MLLDIDAVTNHIQSDSSWCATPISACCNELPLHQYILNASSNDIIELIVSSYPNAVHISDDGGNTPLHCACAVGSTEIIQLLLEYEAVPDICNHANETPLDILKSSCSRTLHSDVYKNITVLIQEKKEKNRIQELRNKRRRRREQIWNMTEEEAWFYAATNGSIPISIGGLNDDFQNVSDAKAETETETETDVHKVETKTANTTATHQSETKSEIKTKTKTTAKSFTKNKFTSMNNINLMQGIEMSGRQVIVELCQEDDFNALIRHPTSSKTALQLACISLHPDIVQALMNSCEISDIQNAVLLLEGIITSIVVERELSTLVMHQADAIRAPPPSSSRQKNKNMKKNGKMKKIKLQRGESKENYNQRKKKSKRKQWTSNESNESNNAMNLNAATDILRMLTGGKHMVFEEDRLRRKQWIKDIPSETNDSLSNGIDAIMRDPKEYAKMTKRIANRQEKRKKRDLERAHHKIEMRKKNRETRMIKEQKRRAKNAKMLVDGQSYDKKKKQYWFQSGWTAERFAVPEVETSYSEMNVDSEYDDFDEQNKTCCCVVS